VQDPRVRMGDVIDVSHQHPPFPRYDRTRKNRPLVGIFGLFVLHRCDCQSMAFSRENEFLPLYNPQSKRFHYNLVASFSDTHCSSICCNNGLTGCAPSHVLVTKMVSPGCMAALSPTLGFLMFQNTTFCVCIESWFCWSIKLNILCHC
jgi:hypothetical protein